MKKSTLLFFVIISLFLAISCSSEEDPITDNPNVTSQRIDTVLKRFYPQPVPDSMSERLFSYNFPVTNSTFNIDMYWYGPAVTHGIYMNFNNFAGEVLLDTEGFIKSFDSGIKIDSTLSGNWSGLSDGKFSLDYISYPSINKGNLAGLGDKYIAFRAFSSLEPQLKYYGWLRVLVTADGRSLYVLYIGYQNNANTSLKTGEV